jgi:hypothetical protein
MILQAVLGLQVMGFDGQVLFDSPTLPPWLDWLQIEGLRVGDGSISLKLRRSANGMAVTEILEKNDKVAVEVRK